MQVRYKNKKQDHVHNSMFIYREATIVPDTTEVNREGDERSALSRILHNTAR